MTRNDQFYARLVSWLRIVLPLAALALLSTLFLFSRTIDPNVAIPFSQIDLRERAREQQATKPYSTGVSERGDVLTFASDTARPDAETDGQFIAQNLTGTVQLPSGTIITFNARDGRVTDATDTARLIGDVVIITSDGYRLTTDAMTTAMRHVEAETDGAVFGIGPPGEITAGKMVLTANPETKGTHMVFTGGVKLIYLPQN